MITAKDEELFVSSPKGKRCKKNLFKHGNRCVRIEYIISIKLFIINNIMLLQCVKYRQAIDIKPFFAYLCN